MQALIKTPNVKELIIQDVALPEPAPGEALIKVGYCGVCGSDLHAYHHAPGYEFVEMPRILGHELVGTVVSALGQDSGNWLNKKVVAESIQHCGTCAQCQEKRTNICEHTQVMGLHFDGGMAEYVKCKLKYLKEIPANLPDAIAVLTEPMTIAVHAVETIGQVKNGDAVLVQGPGIIGFFVALVCKALGAKVRLSGLKRDYKARLSLAQDFGIETFTVDEGENLREQVDILFECSGSSRAVNPGLQSLKKGGKAVFVALYESSTDLFFTQAVRNEWALLTSYGSKPEDYTRAFEILDMFSSQLESLVSLYELNNAKNAFEDAMEQKVLKPVLVL